MYQREQDWQTYLAARKVIHHSKYLSLFKCLRDCLDQDPLSSCIPLKDLRCLICDYAIIRMEIFYSQMRLCDLLTSGISDGIPEEEILGLEGQVSEFDPTDGTVGDYQFRDSYWMLSKDRRRQRFRPVVRQCEGCLASSWVGVRHPHSGHGRGYLRLSRNGIHWLTEPICRGEIDPFMCEDCQHLCYCTSTKIAFYQRFCCMCDKYRCDKHDFTKSAPRPEEPTYVFSAAPRERCDECLHLLEFGRTLFNIIQNPNPHQAFSQFVEKR